MSFVNKIVFLGTASAVPSWNRNSSCMSFILNTGKIILVDVGEGTQHQIMKSKSVKLLNISVILITHLHGDHFFGIFGLLCTISISGRLEPITLVGPKGIQAAVECVLNTQGGDRDDFPYKICYIELEGEEPISLGILVDGIHISAHYLMHRISTYGYILQEPDKEGSLNAKLAMELGASGHQLGLLKGKNNVLLSNNVLIKYTEVLGPDNPGKKIVILQDTCNSDNVIKFAMNCNLLIHEATYHDELADKAKAHFHSTAKMAGEFASKIKAKHLVLTHFSSRYKSKFDKGKTDIIDSSATYVEDLVVEAEGVYNLGSVTAASDFMSLSIQKKNVDIFCQDDMHDIA